MTSHVQRLKKNTLGATYEHINRLLKKGNIDEKDYVNYNPEFNTFEKKVQAIIIDSFKIKEGVINCLLSNDPDLIMRILKCKWFFEDALPPKDYEEKIFPNVSYSTRCKIINQLSRHVKSEKHAEEFFQFISANYGNQFAEMFLPRCSFKFTSNYIKKCKPSFNYHGSERNVINILKRFSISAVPLLKREIEKRCFMGTKKRCAKLIKYMCKNHLAVFIPIFKKYYSEISGIRFGKKSSRLLNQEFVKFAEANPDIVLKGQMNIQEIFKCLNFEEQIIFLKSVFRANTRRFSPTLRSWYDIADTMKIFLKAKRPDERVALVETVFQQLFNERFLDHPELWSLRFLEVLPTHYRARLIEVWKTFKGDIRMSRMLHSQCVDLERDTDKIYIYLMSCEIAFPQLVDLTSQTTNLQRREIVLNEMIRNSHINCDREGLESVVKYITTRHRNEDPIIMGSLVRYILSKPEMMTLRVWDLLEEMVTLLLVNSGDSYLYDYVLQEYVEFKLRNRMDVQPQIKSLLKLRFLNSNGTSVLIPDVKKPCSRALLMSYYDEIFSGDSDYAGEEIKRRLTVCLLSSLNEYNKTVRRIRIKMEDLPFLAESIDKLIKEEGIWEGRHSFITGILNNKCLKNKYAKILLNFSMTPSTWLYLLKCHPEYIMGEMCRVIDHICKSHSEYESFFRYRALIDFSEWTDKIEKVISEKFKTSDSTLEKIRFLDIYSLITNLENYTELVKEYIPKENHLEFNKSQKDFHEIQARVARLIRNVKPVSKNLDVVLKYLHKDYLRCIQPSFMTSCYNSSANVTIPLLRDLISNKGVSVKRVILSSMLDLLPKNEGLQYCRLLWERESHSSMKEYLFRCISRTLKENSSDEVFEILKSWLMEGDEKVANGRLKMNEVPYQFVNNYSIALWQFTEKFETRRFGVVYREEIISYFDLNTITLLSDEFCENVLELYFLRKNSQVKVEQFACLYLLYHPKRMDLKIKFFVDLIAERRTVYSSVRYFIDLLKYNAQKKPELVFSVFEALLEEWPKIYSTCKMFKEFLLLNYMKAYAAAYKVSKSVDIIFGTALGKELREVVNTIPMYGCYVEILGCTLRDFLNDFNFNIVSEYLINSFLGNSFDHAIGIIAINILPTALFDCFKVGPDDPNYHCPNRIQTLRDFNGIILKLFDKTDMVYSTHINVLTDNMMD